MAHFAEINSNNVVVRVLVIPDEEEHRGQDFLANDLNLGGTWIQTSYNHKIRKRFAGIGMTYRKDLDAFIHPQPFPSWSLNEDDCCWYAPVPCPSDIGYIWNEDILNWQKQDYSQK